MNWGPLDTKSLRGSCVIVDGQPSLADDLFSGHRRKIAYTSWHVVIFFNVMVVTFEYCGVGVSLLFAIVTSTISGIQPILRQTLVGNVFFVFSLIL